MRSRWEFVAAPYGDRAGVVRVSEGALSVQLIVYPKVWAAGSGHVELDWDLDAQELVICVAELQLFAITASDAPRRALLSRLASLATVPGRDGGALIRPGVVAGSSTPIPPPKLDVGRALAQLACLYGVLELDACSAGRVCHSQWSTIDRYLVFDAFLRCATDAERARRSHFVPARVRAMQIRGRPLASDLAIHHRYRVYSIRSDTTLLTAQDPAAIVIATALSQVVHCTSAAPGDQLFVGQQKRARELLAFSVVQPVSVEVAQGLIPVAFGYAKDPIATRAVELAALVLHQRGFVTSGTGRASWYRIGISTARLWELLVQEHLIRDGMCEVLDGNSSPSNARIVAKPPWLGVGSAPRRPDIAFRCSSGWHIADAKYKLLQGGTVDPADLNQMFVYAALSTVDQERPCGAHLFFPTCSPSQQVSKLSASLEGLPALTIHALHFPSLDEALGLGGLVSGARGHLRDATSRHWLS
jgi:hypothetical protein